jgi:hypothetical protein
VIGATQSIGVFVDQDTKGVIRLRVGEGHDNWILQAIDGRKVTFERDQRQVTLSLPDRNGMDQQGAPIAMPAPVRRHMSALIRAERPPPASPSGKLVGSDRYRPMRPQTAQQNLPLATWLDGNGQMIRPPK